MRLGQGKEASSISSGPSSRRHRRVSGRVDPRDESQCDEHRNCPSERDQCPARHGVTTQRGHAEHHRDQPDMGSPDSNSTAQPRRVQESRNHQDAQTGEFKPRSRPQRTMRCLTRLHPHARESARSLGSRRARSAHRRGWQSLPTRCDSAALRLLLVTRSRGNGVQDVAQGDRRRGTYGIGSELDCSPPGARRLRHRPVPARPTERVCRGRRGPRLVASPIRANLRVHRRQRGRSDQARSIVVRHGVRDLTARRHRSRRCPTHEPRSVRQGARAVGVERGLTVPLCAPQNGAPAPLLETTSMVGWLPRPHDESPSWER